VAVTASSGVLALTLVVRDEEDIVGANLDYHLAQGVDLILVIDHGSTDGTPQILAEYEAEGRVAVSRDEAPAHDQAQRVNRLLASAANEYGADWVVHCDADEFWMPTAGSLRDVFAGVPDRFGYLRVERRNFLAARDDGRPFHQRMVVRERQSKNLRGHALEPKVAQRPAAASGVAPGNHDLEDPVMAPAPDIGAVEVLHFPMRSAEQFERKVVNTGTGYERLEGRGEGVGVDQLELLEIQRRGELRQHYHSQLRDHDSVEDGLEAGDLLLDDRLQRFMDDLPHRVEESPSVRELLRRAWLGAGVINDARLDAERRVEEAMAAFAGARADVEKLLSTLEEIKGSRVMRYTAAARRSYYRLRPTSSRPR
jgi:glycosyltransferase involved in cell wall biosynthesis